MDLVSLASNLSGAAAEMYTPKSSRKKRSRIIRWLDSNRTHMHKGGYWTIGNEPNTQPSHEFEPSLVRMLIVRLSTYDKVASSISHHLVARTARRVGDVFVDFAYLPPKEDYELLILNNIPLWFGVSSKYPACQFDVIGISNSVVMELVNLPSLLINSGIPLFKSQRLDNDEVPLIVLGGCNSANTSILNGGVEGIGHGLVDAILIGDGEIPVRQLLEILKRAKLHGWKKSHILRQCHGRVSGFYEPDRYEHLYENETLVSVKPNADYVEFPVRKSILYDQDSEDVLYDVPISYAADGTVYLEISRGCGAMCNFCREAWENKPYRERSSESILRSIRRFKAISGVSEVALHAFDVSMHSEFHFLMDMLLNNFGKIQFLNARLDILAEDANISSVLRATGVSRCLFALEGISSRIRAYLNKNITEPQIIRSFEKLLEAQAHTIMMNIILTGLETEEDFAEFDTLVGKLNDARLERNSEVDLLVRVCPLFFEPFSPLQYGDARAVYHNIDSRMDAVLKLCEKNSFHTSIKVPYARAEICQLLTTGDRRLTPVIIDLSLNHDFAYYEDDDITWEDVHLWRTLLVKHSIDCNSCFSEKREANVFPWDDIDVGVSRPYLWQQYCRASSYSEMPYCIRTASNNGHCTRCGACPSKEHIKSVVKRKLNSYEIPYPLVSNTILRVKVRIDKSLSTVPKNFFGHAVARQLMLCSRDFTDSYRHLISHARRNLRNDFCYGYNIYEYAMTKPIPVPVDAAGGKYAEIVDTKWVGVRRLRWDVAAYRIQDTCYRKVHNLHDIGEILARNEMGSLVLAERANSLEKKEVQIDGYYQKTQKQCFRCGSMVVLDSFDERALCLHCDIAPSFRVSSDSHTHT